MNFVFENPGNGVGINGEPKFDSVLLNIDLAGSFKGWLLLLELWLLWILLLYEEEFDEKLCDFELIKFDEIEEAEDWFAEAKVELNKVDATWFEEVKEFEKDDIPELFELFNNETVDFEVNGTFHTKASSGISSSDSYWSNNLSFSALDNIDCALLNDLVEFKRFPIDDLDLSCLLIGVLLFALLILLILFVLADIWEE